MSTEAEWDGRERRAAEVRRTNRLFIRIFIVQIVVMVLLVASIWLSSYQGRVNLVANQRVGCERGKLDRRANAEGWRIAQARATSQGQPEFAARYEQLARGLEERAVINCRRAYPEPKVLEFSRLGSS